jgi:hypothetical protein
MQFLKILLWCLLSFVAAIFTYGNWTWVPVNLWGGLIAEVNLPFMLLVTFLLGVIPTWFYFRTQRWRLAQRLATAERVIADLKPVPVAMGGLPDGPAPEPVAVIAAPPAPTPKPPRTPKAPSAGSLL